MDFLFKKRKLPDFLIIGAQKAGTSALHELLLQHPRIANRPGEVHFFDVHYHLGVNWYREQFPKIRRTDLLVGDKSPYYLYHPLAAERAYHLLPNAKILVLLRNPIDRAYSQYWMNRRKKQESLSFSQAIQVEAERLKGLEDQIIKEGITAPFSSHRIHSYLSRGKYVEQLSRWRSKYPAQQVNICFYEEFRSDPQAVLRQVLSFLELPYFDRFSFRVGQTYSYPPMDAFTREELEEFFLPYNQQLELFLGQKLPFHAGLSHTLQ